MLNRKQNRKQAQETRGKTPASLKNQEVSVELTKEMNQEIENDLKHELMRVREIVLEQDRLAQVLLDKFSFLENQEELDLYCEKLGVSEGVKFDLQAALPKLQELLRGGGEVFSQEVLMAEGDNFEAIYRALGEDAKELFDGEGAQEMIGRIVNAEIDMALRVLSENRERKRLSHRVRGFGADEASVQSFTTALQENIAELEFDTRSSKDHKNVVHHNSTLGESAGRTDRIRDLSLEDLSGVKYKGGEDLCTLKLLFELVEETGNKSTKINIDIKDFDPEALDEILALVHSHDMEHRVAIVSWLPQSLQYLYEKDPTLEYSLSYFPAIRGVGEAVVKVLEALPSGSRLLGLIGTEFAKFRAGQVQGLAAENIKDATVLDANEHHSETAARMQAKNQDLIGRHTLSYTDVPVADEWGYMEIMARVLQNGSVNIQALEPVADKIVAMLLEVPGLGEVVEAHRQQIVDAICGTDRFLSYAEQLQTNGIKVNIFDLKKEGYIDSHIKRLKDAGVEPGVVYYSGRYEGLNTRGRVPEIPLPPTE